jgi:hypothetical protein
MSHSASRKTESYSSGASANIAAAILAASCPENRGKVIGVATEAAKAT